MKKALKIITIFVLFFFFSLVLTGFWFWQKIPSKNYNFLILGMAGGNHPGKDLTDTIIFASLNSKDKKITFISIPRDIWLDEFKTKINSIYHYKGLEETKEIIGQVLNQPIDYTVVVNFEFFKNFIDEIGGITVEVERSFDDYKYPIAGKENDLCGGDPEFKCRYEHIHFEAGKQEMDGETALKFVRSRNAEGEEGTDFARAQRQQKVILAIKQKILSWEILSQPKKLLQLIKLGFSNIETDFPQEELPVLAKSFLKTGGKNIKSFVLNDNLLISPKNSKEKYQNQWVLIPKSGDWKEVQKYIQKLLTTDN